MKLFRIILLICVLSISASVNAGEDSNYKAPEYKKVELDERLGFTVENVNGKLHMNWTPTKIDNFKWYKIVKSQTNSNPSYPEDGGIKFYDRVNASEFYSYAPKGTTYYRICVITNDNSRFCSKVVKIVNNDSEKKDYSTIKNTDHKKEYDKNSDSSNTAIKDSYKKPVVKTNISSSKKIKLKKLVTNFINKLEEKGYEPEKIISAIDRVIDRLEVLVEQKPKYKETVSYLIKYLEEYKDKYDDDFSELEAIFSED